MEKLIIILVGKNAPPVLKQLQDLKVTVQGDIQNIQDDFDALQHLDARNVLPKAKVEYCRGRVIRNLTKILGVRCAFRNMKL